MIQSFEQIVGGRPMRFCASLGEGEYAHRVIISLEDSAETLVVLDASGLLSTLKAEMAAPDQLLAGAIRTAREEGLIERALDTGAVQNAPL